MGSCGQQAAKKQAETAAETPVLMTMALSTIGEWTGTNWNGTILLQSRHFTLNGKGTAVINWGDGTPNDTITLEGDGYYGNLCVHDYTDSVSYDITVTGEHVTFLDCNNRGRKNFTSLDVSKNTALTELNCGSNQLTVLDVSKNTALTRLDCCRNQLTTLDISNNTALTYLECHTNQLTVLDVRNNSALTDLICFNNRLTDLDMSNNMELKHLSCHFNHLTTEALDETFTTLNDNMDMDSDEKRIYIGGNPGTDFCNWKIAASKGWTVYK